MHYVNRFVGVAQMPAVGRSIHVSSAVPDYFVLPVLARLVRVLLGMAQAAFLRYR